MHGVSEISLSPTPPLDVAATYSAVAELSATHATVHFVRVELKDIISEVELGVDHGDVENLFLIFKEGKEVAQTMIESDIEIVLSKALGVACEAKQKRHSRKLHGRLHR